MLHVLFLIFITITFYLVRHSLFKSNYLPHFIVKLEPVVAQGHKRVTVNAAECEFDSHLRK